MIDYTRVFFCAIIFFSLIGSVSFAQDREELFEKKIIQQDLQDPWNIIYGPEGQLWVTESKNYRVHFLDPDTGGLTTILNLEQERKFPRYDTLPESMTGDKPWPQGGLMGMALHPEFIHGKPFVYLAYVYEFEGRQQEGEGRNEKDKGFHFTTRLARYTYDSDTRKLVDPISICDTIPGSNDHNGGRLLIAKVDGEHFLFYSVGDMGAGQFENAARPNRAQDISSYEGKILRFHTEAVNDDWIPDDNPFNDQSKSAVWSLGLRNTQGLTTMEIDGEEIIYASDHGPYSDDEINTIRKAGNYGHPLVIGYVDGNYNGLAGSVTEFDSLPGKWNTTYPLIRNEQENAEEMENYQDPLYSFYPHGNSKLTGLFEELVKGPEKRPDWEAVAHSGITSYTSDAIPGWKNSLLITSLKEGVLYRLKLNDRGDRVTEVEQLFKSPARYRDVTVSPDGKRIFITTDHSPTSGPTEGEETGGVEQGAVIEFRYKGN
jgi:PQQ-dependent dehydrogenase (s-GDH family)